MDMKCELCDRPIKVKLKDQAICFECFNDQRKVQSLVMTLPCLRCNKLRKAGKPCPNCNYE